MSGKQKEDKLGNRDYRQERVLKKLNRKMERKRWERSQRIMDQEE